MHFAQLVEQLPEDLNIEYLMKGQSFIYSAGGTLSSRMMKSNINHNLSSLMMPDTGRTPRSRASIFGFSPPDQHRLSDPEGGQDGCPVDGPAALWNTLDVSIMLTQNYSSSPSLCEILFNSVTSCLCVVDKRRGGKVGIHDEIY